MATTVLIPARLASSRLPNKPLADLAGQPMVVRVAQRAALSRARQVVVAADSLSIVQACEQAGVPCVLTDPGHPSGSNTTNATTHRQKAKAMGGIHSWTPRAKIKFPDHSRHAPRADTTAKVIGFFRLVISAAFAFATGGGYLARLFLKYHCC